MSLADYMKKRQELQKQKNNNPMQPKAATPQSTTKTSYANSLANYSRNSGGTVKPVQPTMQVATHKRRGGEGRGINPAARKISSSSTSGGNTATSKPTSNGGGSSSRPGSAFIDGKYYDQNDLFDSNSAASQAAQSAKDSGGQILINLGGTWVDQNGSPTKEPPSNAISTGTGTGQDSSYQTDLINELKKQIENQNNSQEAVQGKISDLLDTINKLQNPPAIGYSEALRQAQSQLNPLYADEMKATMENMDKDMIARGFYGTAPGAATTKEAAGELVNQQQAHIANLANQLQNMSREDASRQLQMELSKKNMELGGLLNQAGMTNSSAAQNFGSIMSLLNFDQNKQQYMDQLGLKEDELGAMYMGVLNGKTTLPALMNMMQFNANEDSRQQQLAMQAAALTGMYNGKATMPLITSLLGMYANQGNTLANMDSKETQNFANQLMNLFGFNTNQDANKLNAKNLEAKYLGTFDGQPTLAYQTFLFDQKMEQEKAALAARKAEASIGQGWANVSLSNERLRESIRHNAETENRLREQYQTDLAKKAFDSALKQLEADGGIDSADGTLDTEKFDGFYQENLIKFAGSEDIVDGLLK